MSNQHAHFRSWDEDRAHRETVIKKLQKIQGLQALLESWEAQPDVDHDYLRKLRRKLHCARTQYQAMTVTDLRIRADQRVKQKAATR